jgi:hypothetical protein
MRIAMNNKTSLRNSSLFALKTACLALTASGCKAKFDSIGSVVDGGADGGGKGSNSCQSTSTNPSKCDASPGPEVLMLPDAPPISDSSSDVTDTWCQDVMQSHVNAAGETVWWWRYHWDWAGQDLSALCASWGNNAKMILEVLVPPSTTDAGVNLPTCTPEAITTGAGPACMVENSRRFEVACTDGRFLLELPSQYAFSGYYHIESPSYPNSPRHTVYQDVHCSHDLYSMPSGPTATETDGGSSVPTAETGAETGAGCACVLPAPMTWSQTTWDCYCSVHDCSVSLAAFTASLSAYGWSTDDYVNCDLRVLSIKFSGSTDMASKHIFQISSGKMVGSFDTADVGVACPFDNPDAGRLLGLLAGTQVDASCVRSSSSCADAGASTCFR